jgi:hypothetical protein
MMDGIKYYRQLQGISNSNGTEFIESLNHAENVLDTLKEQYAINIQLVKTQ